MTRIPSCLVCQQPVNGDDWERHGERFCCTGCRGEWQRQRGEDLGTLFGQLPTDALQTDAWYAVTLLLRNAPFHAQLPHPIFTSDPEIDALHGPVRTRRMEPKQ